MTREPDRLRRIGPLWHRARARRNRRAEAFLLAYDHAEQTPRLGLTPEAEQARRLMDEADGLVKRLDRL